MDRSGRGFNPRPARAIRERRTTSSAASSSVPSKRRVAGGKSGDSANNSGNIRSGGKSNSHSRAARASVLNHFARPGETSPGKTTRRTQTRNSARHPAASNACLSGIVPVRKTIRAVAAPLSFAQSAKAAPNAIIVPSRTRDKTFPPPESNPPTPRAQTNGAKAEGASSLHNRAVIPRNNPAGSPAQVANNATSPPRFADRNLIARDSSKTAPAHSPATAPAARNPTTPDNSETTTTNAFSIGGL